MPVIQQDTARIFDLQNPTAKMSKSASRMPACCGCWTSPSVSAKKIMRAVTDSEGSVRYDREKKPGVSNLLVIYAALTGRQIPAIEDEYAGRGYGDFKKGWRGRRERVRPVRARALELLDDTAELDRVLAANADGRRGRGRTLPTCTTRSACSGGCRRGPPPPRVGDAVRFVDV
jgi:tryptophanyl-tRNA synthetase